MTSADTAELRRKAETARDYDAGLHWTPVPQGWVVIAANELLALLDRLEAAEARAERYRQGLVDIQARSHQMNACLTRYVSELPDDRGPTCSCAYDVARAALAEEGAS